MLDHKGVPKPIKIIQIQNKKILNNNMNNNTKIQNML